MATVSRTVNHYEIQAVQLYLDEEGNPQKELICTVSCSTPHLNRAVAKAACAEALGHPMPRNTEYTWTVVGATRYTMDLCDFMEAAEAEDVDVPTDAE